MRAYCEAAADALEAVAALEGYPGANVWRARARELARREQAGATGLGAAEGGRS